MPEILHRVGIKAPPDKVCRALTVEQELAGWWTKNTKASPTVGAINQFRFNEQGFNDLKVAAPNGWCSRSAAQPKNRSVKLA